MSIDPPKKRVGTKREDGEFAGFLRLYKSLAESPVQVAIGLAIVAVGLLRGDTTGQVLVGLGGVLISSSAAANYAAVRKETEVRRIYDAQLSNVGRQLVNVYKQMQTNESELDPDVSLALIRQTNQNLYFLIQGIDQELEGGLDIRAEETNEMLARVGEQIVTGVTRTLAVIPEDEEVDISEVVREEIARLQASTTLPAASSRPATRWAQVLHEIAARIPGPTSLDPDEWRDWLRRLVQSLADRDHSGSLATRGIPLTTVGHVVRNVAASEFPRIAGLQTLTPLLQFALAGTRWCVVASGPTYRAVAIRTAIPDGMRALEDIELVDGWARISGGEDPSHHSTEEYRKLLLAKIPKLSIPDENLVVVLEAAAALPAGEFSREELIEHLRRVSGERLDASGASRSIALLVELRLLEVNRLGDPEGGAVYRPILGGQSPEDVRLLLRSMVESEIEGRLGRVDSEILTALCGSPTRGDYAIVEDGGAAKEHRTPALPFSDSHLNEPDT